MRDEYMAIETYKLTFTHYIRQGEMLVELEEPKTMMISCCALSSDSIFEFDKHLIDELCMRMREEILRGV